MHLGAQSAPYKSSGVELENDKLYPINSGVTQ